MMYSPGDTRISLSFKIQLFHSTCGRSTLAQELWLCSLAGWTERGIQLVYVWDMETKYGVWDICKSSSGTKPVRSA